MKPARWAKPIYRMLINSGMNITVHRNRLIVHAPFGGLSPLVKELIRERAPQLAVEVEHSEMRAKDEIDLANLPEMRFRYADAA